MAAIGKIRENSTLLLIVIGCAMLAFILGDLLSGRMGTPEEQYVGEIAGENISVIEFESRVQEEEESRAVTGQPVDANSLDAVRSQVWNQLVIERSLLPRVNKAGFNLTKEEYDDLRFGDNVDPTLANDPTFVNPETGQFDPERVKQYYGFIQQQYPVFHKVQQQRMIVNRTTDKYMALLSSSLRATGVEVEDKYNRDNTRASFRYIVKRYDSVADSTLEISDGELQAYLREHSDDDRFQLQASADVHYVVYTVEPSEQDIADANARMQGYIEDFKNTENDSAFVFRYAQTKRYPAFDYVSGTLDAETDAQLLSAQVGDVVGPYTELNRVKIAKVVGTREEDQARVRHILLTTANGETIEQIKERADSLMRVVKREDNFTAMVERFSEDQASVPNGGVYEWFNRERMVAEFTEASFKPVGTMSVVETTYGVHLVEVLGRRTQNMPQILVVDRLIEPSGKTADKVYAQASELSINAKSLEDMERIAGEQGLEVRSSEKVNILGRLLPGAPGTREAVRWANNEETEEGTVSPVFEGTNNFVVVHLDKRRDEGPATLEDVRDKVLAEVAKEKKAELFAEELQGTSLNEIASATGLTVATVSNVNGTSPSLGSGLSEPYVVGKAIALGEGQTSQPLEGKSGVYVIEVTAITLPSGEPNTETVRADLNRTYNSRVGSVNGAVLTNLKKIDDIKDRRSRIY